MGRRDKKNRGMLDQERRCEREEKKKQERLMEESR